MSNQKRYHPYTDLKNRFKAFVLQIEKSRITKSYWWFAKEDDVPALVTVRERVRAADACGFKVELRYNEEHARIEYHYIPKNPATPYV